MMIGRLIRKRKNDGAGERGQIITGVHWKTEELMFDRTRSLLNTGRKSRQNWNKCCMVDLTV